MADRLTHMPISKTEVNPSMMQVNFRAEFRLYSRWHLAFFRRLVLSAFVLRWLDVFFSFGESC